MIVGLQPVEIETAGYRATLIIAAIPVGDIGTG
jgi:hypothetical protein